VKVLIVDDEPVARRILNEELEFLPGIEVIGEAQNGVEALEKIASLKPDLVLLDLQMPIMTGLEVLHALSGVALPTVVIVTAYHHHAAQALASGASGYLLKPVDGARLRQAVGLAQESELARDC
jgi:two-component system LytT family response regulator